jgi:hypothetical protein
VLSSFKVLSGVVSFLTLVLSCLGVFSSWCVVVLVLSCLDVFMLSLNTNTHKKKQDDGDREREREGGRCVWGVSWVDRTIGRISERSPKICMITLFTFCDFCCLADVRCIGDSCSEGNLVVFCPATAPSSFSVSQLREKEDLKSHFLVFKNGTKCVLPSSSVFFTVQYRYVSSSPSKRMSTASAPKMNKVAIVESACMIARANSLPHKKKPWVCYCLLSLFLDR